MSDFHMLSMFNGVVGEMWFEFAFITSFAIGFSFLRTDVISLLMGRLVGAKGAKLPRNKLNSGDEKWSSKFDYKLQKNIEAEAAAGHNAAVVKAWRAGRSTALTPLHILRSVASALLEEHGENYTASFAELIDHLREHARYVDSRTIIVLLDIVARVGKAEVLENFWRELSEKVNVNSTIYVYEVLLGGFAMAGRGDKIDLMVDELRQKGLKLSARAHAVMIKGFLKNNMVDKVFEQTVLMRQEGFYLPPFALTQLCRIACEADRGMEVFEKLLKLEVTLTPEGIVCLLEECVKANDLETAVAIETHARTNNVDLPLGAFDGLLKLYTNAGDVRALDLFKELQNTGHRVSEGLCVGLLARCAESKFIRFAEELAVYLKTKGNLTIAMFSALMKAYAYSGMYDKACDLYQDIQDQKLEPDAIMYGCLMKFAVECGRTDLSRTLSERAPKLQIQNYMSLIRAAGRDRDVDKAFGVLDKLRQSGVIIDTAANNCVLDVCVSCGDMLRARQHFNDMKGDFSPDMITYNTLLKGYCNKLDVASAKALMQDMKKNGHSPNDISYNCMINAAISAGRIPDAWELVEDMKSEGVAVDSFTVSIMLKSLRKVKGYRDVQRTLGLLDSADLDICKDEVLLNTVMETCVRHREYNRLMKVLNIVESTGMRPSLHTFAVLIKSYSALGNTAKCWSLWGELTKDRGMQVDEMVLGCMLDALVINNAVGDAMDLWNGMKVHVKPNSVIYSTLIKGCASTHAAELAMKIFAEMRAEKIDMNTVVYNSVIDAHARSGMMDEVTKLIKSMDDDGCIPDSITYSTIVKGYCVAGELQTAFEVFRGMQKSNMAGDSIVYNTLLDGCTRHSQFELADQVLETMRKNGVGATNFTLGIMMKMYGRRKQVDKAFEMFEELPKRHGFRANVQVRTGLLAACLSNGAIDKAQIAFQGLKDHECADFRAYSTMINGCTRHGALEKAVSLVEEVYGLTPGIKKVAYKQIPEGDFLEPLLRELGRQGLMDKIGVPLVRRVHASGHAIGGRLLTSVLNSHTEVDNSCRKSPKSGSK